MGAGAEDTKKWHSGAGFKLWSQTVLLHNLPVPKG